MEIQSLSGSTLLIIQASDLQEFARSLMRDQPQAPASPVIVDDTPLTQSEAVKFLSVTRPTFLRWRKAGKISGHVLGGRVYFFKSELIKAMKTVM